MTQTEEFNPIETARKVEESYREYIATTIHFADADLQSQLEEILRKLSSNLSRYHRSPGLVPAISKRRYRE